MTDNTSSLQEADPQEEISVLKEALRLQNEEINRLRVKAEKWDAIGEGLTTVIERAKIVLAKLPPNSGIGNPSTQ